MNNKAMSKTHEVLDNILGLLLAFESKMFKPIFKSVNPKVIDMEFISKQLSCYEWEDWMKESLKNKLISNEYVIEHENSHLSLTALGRNFKKNGGYQVQILSANEYINTNTYYDEIRKKYNRKVLVFGLVLFMIQMLALYFV